MVLLISVNNIWYQAEVGAPLLFMIWNKFMLERKEQSNFEAGFCATLLDVRETIQI